MVPAITIITKVNNAEPKITIFIYFPYISLKYSNAEIPNGCFVKSSPRLNLGGIGDNLTLCVATYEIRPPDLLNLNGSVVK
jgi:hypothetical protein